MTPLPDANNKSPRVYTLTQNTDLENLAFATMQSIGQPISIEEMSEDELRRLVLVNLARLSVKGEWNGLLTGGGSDFNAVLMPTGDYKGAPYGPYTQNLGSSAPWGNAKVSNRTLDFQQVHMWPFIAAEDGALASMSVECTVASADGETRVGIYNESNGIPTTLIGYGSFDCTTTGTKTQTSFSATITLEKGKQYWYAESHTTSNLPQVAGLDPDNNPGILGRANSPTKNIAVRLFGETVLPSTVDTSDIVLGTVGRLGLNVAW